MTDAQVPAADLARARARLADAERVLVLTGAGVSAESGVPTFRGPEGLWRSYPPEELATPEAFRRDPRLVWEWYAWRQDRVRGCAPNAAHHALGLLFVAWACTRWPGSLTNAAGWAFVVGVLVFSGSLYVLVLSGQRWMGAITPLGGVAMLVGWALLGWQILKG